MSLITTDYNKSIYLQIAASQPIRVLKVKEVKPNKLGYGTTTQKPANYR